MQPDTQAPTTAARKPRMTFAPAVVLPSLLVLGALLVLCGFYPQRADQLFGSAQAWVVTNFDWFYTVAVTGFLVFLVLIAWSRYGDIRLGPDDAKPEFSFASWTAMLFAAGMGIGLMYFGVGEPLQHYLNPPTQEAGTPAAAREALTSTFFHWGFQAWAIYGVMGLVLAYFGFRYNLPLTMRSGLYPLLQKRINGPIGHSVDAFALVGTIAGLATTLGYGALQLAAGLNLVTGWDTGTTAFRIAVIVVVVGLAGLSAASGLDKGVKRLSEVNLLITFALLGFVLLCGPTVFLLQAFSENIGNYLSSLVGMSLRTFTYEVAKDDGWFGGWTILYWAWWISWSPFVGMFIARISRGRTVREFIVGVLFIPTAFNLLWMTVFGNGAIWIDTHVAQGALSATASNVDALLFRFFEYLPLAKAVSWIAVLLITLFFVTSADSGAYVVDAIASRGHPQSPVWQRLFWAVVLGMTAVVLLLAGGLKALQAMTLVTALPVAAIMVLLCIGLWRGMKADLAHAGQDLAPATSFWTGQHWRKRLEQIVHQPTEADVNRFLKVSVLPAMQEVVAEMRKQGVDARVQDDTAVTEGADAGSVRLIVPITGLRDFVYGVRPVTRRLPGFMLTEVTDDEANVRRHVVEPITFFEDGREGYDVQYLRQEELIADILRNYERYLSLMADQRTVLLNRAPGHTE
ncbi:transporter [Comamonas kerstersii]|uniref:Transporter n=1 Tax=Comamonas kerstersii TaxID=225992 RepID=A0A0W7Z462_9BURK|nr:BCCT family transporter [Comamonas kerstersii]AQZ99401.1 transporter [Comamonas kerstersii]KUF42120.1 transporter [Comamonas kerstersii]OOH85532.1 transporter [Comamonas kerstersii]OOH93881.1 transporter [Comamonas kerstersii]